jgi:hypothetical protein
MYLAPLSTRVGAAGRVYAQDIAPRFLEPLRARADKERLTNVDVVHRREDSVALEPASIDLAWVCDTWVSPPRPPWWWAT